MNLKQNNRVPSLFDAYLDEDFIRYLNDRESLFNDFYFGHACYLIRLAFRSSSMLSVCSFLEYCSSNEVWFSQFVEEDSMDRYSKSYKMLLYVDYFKMLDKDWFINVVLPHIYDKVVNG